MKKIGVFLVLLALVGALSTTALASAPTEPFSLRNRYYWDMSKDEAIKLAAEEGLVSIASQDERLLIFENVPVGEFSVTMFLRFSGDSALRYIAYQFPSFPKDDKTELEEQFNMLVKTLNNAYKPVVGVVCVERECAAFWDLPDTRISLKSWYDPANRFMQYWNIGYIPRKVINTSGF